MTLAELNIGAVLPEILVSSMACFILLVELVTKPHKSCALAWPLTAVSLLGAGYLSLEQLADPSGSALNGLVIQDGVSAVLRATTCLAAVVVLFYSRAYSQERGLWRVEYLVLALFGVVGMMTMIGSAHLLTLYVGIELLALCLYGMIAMQRDSVAAAEAAMKYFILGALASGLLLYGMSLLYGLTGSLSLDQISDSTLTRLDPSSLPLTLAVVMVIAGLLFKLGAVPFHMWVPDVYEGSATSTTLYLSAVPKLAAFAILLRLLISGLGGWLEIWQDVILVAAVLSIGLGNIIAIAQSNIKRMFAYSTISHMGFLLLGFSTAGELGLSAAMMYTLIYMFTTLVAFGVVLALSRPGFECDQLDDLRGLNRRNPLLALMMLVAMFSLAGIPPTAGFFAKLFVLEAALEAGFIEIVVVAVLFAVVGAFYYLRIVKLMYFDDPSPHLLSASSYGYRPVVGWALGINALLVVLMIPWMGNILNWIVASL